MQGFWGLQGFEPACMLGVGILRGCVLWVRYGQGHGVASGGTCIRSIPVCAVRWYWVTGSITMLGLALLTKGM